MMKITDRISFLLLICVLHCCYATIPITRCSVFASITKNPAFVDKTDLIKTFLGANNFNSTYVLITCPPRFGKSINLDMIKQFAQYNENQEMAEEIRKIFTDSKLNLNIYKDKLFFEYHFAKRIVIHLDFFVDDDFKTYDEIVGVIETQIRDAVTQHNHIFTQSKDTYTVNPEVKILFNKIVYGEPTVTELICGLSNLSSSLLAYYGKSIVLLVDNFDEPVRQAVKYGANAKEIIKFCRSLFTQVFHEKVRHTSYAMLIGVSSMIGDIMLSDIKYIKHFKFAEEHEYMKYFGFMEEDIHSIFETKRFLLNRNNRIEIQRYCNGYQGRYNQIGIFNPSTVVDYLLSRRLEDHWPLIGSISHLQYGLKDTYLRNVIENACSQEKVTFLYERGLNLNDSERLEKMFSMEKDIVIDTTLYLGQLFEMGYLSYWPTVYPTWYKPILTSFYIPNHYVRLQLAYDFYKFFTGMIEEGEKQFAQIFLQFKRIIESNPTGPVEGLSSKLAGILQITFDNLNDKNGKGYELLTEDYRFLLYSAALYGSLYPRNQSKTVCKLDNVECSSLQGVFEKPMIDPGGGRVDVSIVGNNGSTLLFIDVKSYSRMYESLNQVLNRVSCFRPDLHYLPIAPDIVKFLAIFINEKNQVQVAFAPTLQHAGRNRWMAVSSASADESSYFN